MSLVFYDCEFIESGPGKPITLISIGLVREDGQELYCISSEFNPADCNDWVKEHVLTKLEPEDQVPRLTLEEIGAKIKEFVGKEPPEFWGYYPAYDHVVLCQTVWGIMADLPDTWPKYTLDIKQLAVVTGTDEALPPDPEGEHSAIVDAKYNKTAYEAVVQAIAKKGIVLPGITDDHRSSRPRDEKHVESSVDERLTAALPYQWHTRKHSGEVTAQFDVDSPDEPRTYTVNFQSYADRFPDRYGVELRVHGGSSTPSSWLETDAVLSTVVAITGEFLRRYRPEQVVFVAISRSRALLFYRMARKLLTGSDYKVTATRPQDIGNSTFIIQRVLTESKSPPSDPQQKRPDGWHAVDLDGVLAEYHGYKGPDHIGDPVPAMWDRVTQWLDNGERVKIFTARLGDSDAAEAEQTIKQWLRKHGLPDLEITNLKDPRMIDFYDDKAWRVERNTGRVVGQEEPKKITEDDGTVSALGAIPTPAVGLLTPKGGKSLYTCHHCGYKGVKAPHSAACPECGERVNP